MLGGIAALRTLTKDCFSKLMNHDSPEFEKNPFPLCCRLETGTFCSHLGKPWAFFQNGWITIPTWQVHVLLFDFHNQCATFFFLLHKYYLQITKLSDCCYRRSSSPKNHTSVGPQDHRLTIVNHSDQSCRPPAQASGALAGLAEHALVLPSTH